ncbi:MAG: DUF3240 family protein [Pseudomonadota bacterium]|nr:DUF3240 family protein [Pseudomonadota bacterium]
MKNLVLIVNTSVVQSITDQLRALDVPGFTVSHVEGHGAHTAADQFLSARDRVVGFVPRVRVDVVLPAERVDAVLDALRQPGAGLAGHGVYWVAPVEQFGQF